MTTSKIEKMEGDSVVLRLSRQVDAKILALLTRLLEAVDAQRDDLYIPPEPQPFPPSVMPTPPFPRETVVCYGCVPQIWYGNNGGEFTVTCSSSLNISQNDTKK